MITTKLACSLNGSFRKSFLPKDAMFQKHDLEVVGISAGNREFRVAASATRAEVGEPIEFNGSYTSGVSSANTVVLAAADTAVIGTDVFVGRLMPTSSLLK